MWDAEFGSYEPQRCPPSNKIELDGTKQKEKKEKKKTFKNSTAASLSTNYDLVSH